MNTFTTIFNFPFMHTFSLYCQTVNNNHCLAKSSSWGSTLPIDCAAPLMDCNHFDADATAATAPCATVLCWGWPFLGELAADPSSRLASSCQRRCVRKSRISSSLSTARSAMRCADADLRFCSVFLEARVIRARSSWSNSRGCKMFCE